MENHPRGPYVLCGNALAKGRILTVRRRSTTQTEATLRRVLRDV